MRFSIVGTGNIALFYGLRLVAAGHTCSGVYGRDADAAGALAKQLGSYEWGGIAEVNDGLADICVLTVSDTAIQAIADLLQFRETVLIHTAGAVSLDVLQTGAGHRALLWPIYSISRNSLPQHRNIPCAWEATAGKASDYVLQLGKAISDHVFEAGYEQRKWLHLSAVISNNFTNHLMAICEQICGENKLPFAVLMPIIEQTFERLKTASPADVQTGPAVRGDKVTIERQMNLLSGHPQWQKIYEAITLSIQANKKQ